MDLPSEFKHTLDALVKKGYTNFVTGRRRRRKRYKIYISEAYIKYIYS